MKLCEHGEFLMGTDPAAKEELAPTIAGCEEDVSMLGARIEYGD